MNGEINIVNEKAKKEKFLNFIIKYKNLFYILGSVIFILLIVFFLFKEIQNKKNIKISNNYNLVLLNYKIDNKKEFLNELRNIINSKNKTYSPLALFFIIDNNILENINEINKLFDIILNNKKLDQEIINLLIYKKALLNSDTNSEIEIINMIQPILNSKSIWKPHSLLLLGDYFLSKNEKLKAKEYYNKILLEKNIDPNLSREAQSRIRSMGSE